MTLHIGATPETKEITDINDTLIPADIMKVISETAHHRLLAFKNTIHEAQVDSETIHATVLIAHAHQILLAWKTDVQVEVVNIPAPGHLYTTCNLSDVEDHNIHLQIANVLHHRVKSRRT